MSRIAGWERAGLARDPFPTTTDGLRVPIDGIDRELDLLHHLVQFGEQVMVVTGPAGAGKTAFVEALRLALTERGSLSLPRPSIGSLPTVVLRAA